MILRMISLSFLFANAHELAALLELPYIQRLVYLMGIRPYMDRQSCIVGIKRRISYQSLRETLYVGPIAGVKTGSPSLQQMKRAVKSLERAGLIEIQSTERHLIVKCIYAELDNPDPKKAVPKPYLYPDTNPTQEDALESGESCNFRQKLNIANNTEADPPQKSEDYNYIYMCSKFEKFWKSYPHPVDREAAFYQFRELNPDDKLFEKIMARLHGQIESYNLQVMLSEWVPKWKYPANWLAKKCWQTDPYVFEQSLPVVHDLENQQIDIQEDCSLNNT
ncbi:TPA: hypothetical protein KKX11_001064 [Legionella pneumophila]|uniref:hypothetical protein n=2 Tax=Legionella pneumophila TaxID=446 RepID=UPI00058FB7F1|nr:hypothetical protein [Legionella pneumophila]HAT9299780.1 hypothetical protein [Legionella pneumophila subsp. pneumophila]HAT1978833.1 hypothetical protein [Legionella pneumophila]HAT2113842.1 hypothetical protein [Legionella pneumophila]HAT8315219.1 hypothetical protein [Legionella pneumophila]HAT8370477.1 hypothetical protein [Legionella pneumophila]